MKIFVYGTLKRGYGNYARLLKDRAGFINEGVTTRTFDMIDIGFPMIFPVDDGDRVRGEVFEIDASTLKQLDRLEGEGSMYHRRLELIQLDDGHVELCMIYIGVQMPWSGYSSELVSPSNDGFLVWPQTKVLQSEIA